jgi:hypothetical protein
MVAPSLPRCDSRPTVAIWHRHLERAEFEPFTSAITPVVSDSKGQRPTEVKQFRERVWPVFWRIRPVRRTTDAWELRRSQSGQSTGIGRWTKRSG